MDSFASVDGLPACPDDITEVELANVLFNPLCQVLVNYPPVLFVFSPLGVTISTVASHVCLSPGQSVVECAKIAKAMSESQWPHF